MAQTHSLDLELSSSQYAGITDASQTGLDITGDFSIEAWVKLEQLQSTAGTDFYIADKLTGSTVGGYRLFITSDLLTCDYTDSSDNITRADTNSVAFTSADVGVWVHIAVSVDVSAQSFTFYKNGRVLANTNVFSAASSVGNGARDFRVGANSNSTVAGFYDGLIKDVRVFNDIRSASEIQADAHTENVSDANLVGEWNFNNAYTDSSGNSNTLTSSGSPTFATNYPWEKPAQVSGSTFLETNLNAYYTMEETSGTRLDSTTNNNDLTDNNTVTAGTGIIDNGADFEATNSEYLSIADNASLSFTGDFSASFWVNPEDISIEPVLISKWNGAGSRSYYLQLRMGATDTMRISTSTDGTAQTTADVSISNYSAGVFHHIVVSYDASAGAIEVFEDGISRGTAGSLSTAIADTGAVFEVGRYTEGASNYYDGILDEVALYARVLHYGDVLDLYNSGAGITFEAATGQTRPPAINSTGSFMMM